MFDQVGFLSPLIIQLKKFFHFQIVCGTNVEWDQPRAPDLQYQWANLIADLQSYAPIELPRCYFAGVDGELTSVELHGFCDASVEAYAAVII